MENASKALIIAGAILLAILIIGLGMSVFSGASGVLKGINLDSQKIEAYNRDLEEYSGTISGTKARALCDLVRNRNLSNSDDPTQMVKITQTGTPSTTIVENAEDAGVSASTINEIKAKLGAGKTYTVTLGYEAKSGLIVGVDIKEK